MPTVAAQVAKEGCHVSSDFQATEKATEKQIAYIKSLGGVAPKGLTKRNASDLIQRLLTPIRPASRKWWARVRPCADSLISSLSAAG